MGIGDGLFGNELGLAGRQHFAVVAQRMRDFVRIGIEIGVGLAEQPFDCGAVGLGRGLVHEHEATVPVLDKNETGIRIDDLIEETFVTAQCLSLLCPF